jgi:hypothetical protein
MVRAALKAVFHNSVESEKYNTEYQLRIGDVRPEHDDMRELLKIFHPKEMAGKHDTVASNLLQGMNTEPLDTKEDFDRFVTKYVVMPLGGNTENDWRMDLVSTHATRLARFIDNHRTMGVLSKSPIGFWTMYLLKRYLG